jgi:hypothetical protein
MYLLEELKSPVTWFVGGSKGIGFLSVPPPPIHCR